MKLNYLTQNQFKIKTAELALSKFPKIKLEPIDLDIPEIQAKTNLMIARDSALKAAQELNQPVVREDHGFCFEAFPGWPGPYMAQAETSLPAKSVLNLLRDQSNRRAYFDIAMVYAQPEGQTWEREFQVPCFISHEIKTGPLDFEWDKVICFGDNDTRAICQYSLEERYQMFTANFEALAKYLLNAKHAS